MRTFLKSYVKKFFLNTLLKANFRREEVAEFRMSEGYPTIILQDGTTLSSFGARDLPNMEHLGIPKGFEEVVLAYLTRYKFPHFMPQRKMKPGMIPINWMPYPVHPQHQNTLQELPGKLAGELTEILSLSAGDRVLEIGSFIGFGTVQMSRLVGSRGKVVAVEADDAAFAVLTKNVRQNNLSNAISRNYAIGDNDRDEATFWKSRMQANSLVEIKGAKPGAVRMRKISSVLNETELIPNFIILTINGFELKALESSRELLNEARPLRVITPGWYKDEQGYYAPRIIKLLKSHNFKVFSTKGMHIFAYKV